MKEKPAETLNPPDLEGKEWRSSSRERKARETPTWGSVREDGSRGKHQGSGCVWLSDASIRIRARAGGEECTYWRAEESSKERLARALRHGRRLHEACRQEKKKEEKAHAHT